MGAVVGGAASNLFFEWNGDLQNDLPDWQLTAAAGEVGLEMRSLAPSLAAPIDGSVSQPTVTVRSTSATRDVAPPTTPAGYVRAAAYREAPTPGTADCVHVVAVNAKPSAATVSFILTGVNATTATQPLLWDAQVNHPNQSLIDVSVVAGTSGVSAFDDIMGPTSTAIYRLGCEVETRPGNLLANPDMESPSAAGNVYGWGLSMHDADRDTRAAVHADTSRPAHGRTSLRLVVPTLAPITLPVSNAGATPAGCSGGDQGFQFPKAGRYAISLMARSSAKGMNLAVLSGSWEGVLSNYSGTNLGNFSLGSDWQKLEANVTVKTVATSCFQVQASGAVGQVWLDDFFVGKI